MAGGSSRAIRPESGWTVNGRGVRTRQLKYMVGFSDIYFTSAYGRLYEKLPAEQYEKYTFENEKGQISNRFLLRRIPFDDGSGKEWYDIVTPYGYGGPVIDALTPPFSQEELIADYVAAFTQYAKERNIVAEFVRFHPVSGNGADFREAYNAELDRQTVGTNLTWGRTKEAEEDVKKGLTIETSPAIAANFDKVFHTEVTARTRKKLRHMMKKGMSFEYNDHPADLNDFEEIYYATLDRNDAGRNYYFSDSYFKKMIEEFPGQLLTVKTIYEGKTIAMGLYFRSSGVLHIHLSGTRTEYLPMSPAYILRYALLRYGVEHGYDMVHHGGGRTNAPDDPLYEFKKHFGQVTKFDYYLGRKVWNEEEYDKLCRMTGADKTGHYFPAYRAMM